jgi:glutathione S-transferase
MSTDTGLELVIGNKNYSSWSMRPWFLMRQAGIPFRERVFLFEEPNWRERVAAFSPSLKVPVLHHGDVAIHESLAICEYVADLHPEAKLWPEDRTARGIARAVSMEMHAGFANLRKDLSMDIVARIPRRERSRETESEIARVQKVWDESRARFGSGGPFLFGRFSIADAMFAPVVWRFRSYDVEVKDRTARAWYEMMLELPVMKEWERDAEAEVPIARALLAQHGTTPDPKSATHCFAVIFASQYSGTGVPDGYDAAADAMVALAKKQPGFLGIESARGADGFGITVSYWDSLEAIKNWREHPEHRAVQARGRESYYARYDLRVCSVERGYRFDREREREKVSHG